MIGSETLSGHLNDEGRIWVVARPCTSGARDLSGTDGADNARNVVNRHCSGPGDEVGSSNSDLLASLHLAEARADLLNGRSACIRVGYCT